MISFFIFHQDVGFSLMQHPRFPHGTLFITFEQGFRWYVEDWLPLRVRTNTSQFPTYEFLSMKIEVQLTRISPMTMGWTQREEEKQWTTKGSAARVSQRTKPVGPDTEFSREIFDLACALSRSPLHIGAMGRWCGSGRTSRRRSGARRRASWASVHKVWRSRRGPPESSKWP